VAVAWYQYDMQKAKAGTSEVFSAEEQDMWNTSVKGQTDKAAAASSTSTTTK
jgi:hypothetical protein